jgi:hypothetical protein
VGCGLIMFKSNGSPSIDLLVVNLSPKKNKKQGLGNLQS